MLNSNASNARDDGNNTVSFSRTVFGQAFGSDTIAVTTYYASSDNLFTEADVVFNAAKTWDSYRGPLRRDTKGNAIPLDFQRVAIHEFGHVLGLDHPDQHNQYLPAVMNSRVSDTDVMQADDVRGVGALYAPPSGVGQLVATLDVRAEHLLHDVARNRVYATLPEDNALAIIDVAQLQVIAPRAACPSSG